MAVYTDVSDEDLANFVSEYDIGRVLSFKGIAEGVENSNFLLHTEAGFYILTLYEKRVNPDDLPFFLGLMGHLFDSNIKCPLPVLQRNGETLGTLSGRPAAIISFLDGIWVKRPTARHCAQLGAGLAAMHLAGQKFQMTRKNSLSVTDWRALYESCGGRADSVMPGLSLTIESGLNRLEKSWPSGLPSGVIHADLFPDNVFFLQGELSGFIDFYFACTDMLVYDLAICLNAWCFEPDHSLNITKARALIENYERVRALSDEEYDALPLMAEGSAMRFLLTRLFDWLDVPEGALVTPKDPVEYLKKMEFHRSVSAAASYGLDR